MLIKTLNFIKPIIALYVMPFYEVGYYNHKVRSVLLEGFKGVSKGE